jgi:hypothetical protein
LLSLEPTVHWVFSPFQRAGLWRAVRMWYYACPDGSFGSTYSVMSMENKPLGFSACDHGGRRARCDAAQTDAVGGVLAVEGEHVHLGGRVEELKITFGRSMRRGSTGAWPPGTPATGTSICVWLKTIAANFQVIRSDEV